MLMEEKQHFVEFAHHHTISRKHVYATRRGRLNKNPSPGVLTNPRLRRPRYRPHWTELHILFQKRISYANQTVLHVTRKKKKKYGKILGRLALVRIDGWRQPQERHEGSKVLPRSRILSPPSGTGFELPWRLPKWKGKCQARIGSYPSRAYTWSESLYSPSKTCMTLRCFCDGKKYSHRVQS